MRKLILIAITSSFFISQSHATGFKYKGYLIKIGVNYNYFDFSHIDFVGYAGHFEVAQGSGASDPTLRPLIGIYKVFLEQRRFNILAGISYRNLAGNYYNGEKISNHYVATDLMLRYNVILKTGYDFYVAGGNRLSYLLVSEGFIGSGTYGEFKPFLLTPIAAIGVDIHILEKISLLLELEATLDLDNAVKGGVTDGLNTIKSRSISFNTGIKF